ncbi:MAG: hypothetical protein V1790_04880 [Planctomycetota bacterium]
MVATNNMLGLGLYTPAEAAFYARVPVQTLNRWFYGNAQGRLVAEPRFSRDERLVTFLDFVQALAIRNARVNYSVPLNTIREGIDRAKREYAVEYPLARRRTIHLFGKDLYIELEGADYHKITGTNRRQGVMKTVVELYMDDLGFDASGVANSYVAFKWARGDAALRTIRMDPSLRLGEPIVENCAISARTLWEACQAEGGLTEAARVYGVDIADVDAACRYIDHLTLPRAA